MRTATMARDVQIRLDRAAIDRLVDEPGARDVALDAGAQMAEYARLLAPKLTGEGARSIEAYPGHDAAGWFADVSWDQTHFYMIFAEYGTQFRPEETFIRPAMDRYLNL
jgi:HK97 gp10 family phage protein